MNYKIIGLFEYLLQNGGVGKSANGSGLLRCYYKTPDILNLKLFLTFLENEGYISFDKDALNDLSDVNWLDKVSIVIWLRPKGLDYYNEYQRQLSDEKDNRQTKRLSRLTFFIAFATLITAIVPLLDKSVDRKAENTNRLLQETTNKLTQLIQHQTNQKVVLIQKDTLQSK